MAAAAKIAETQKFMESEVAEIKKIEAGKWFIWLMGI